MSDRHVGPHEADRDSPSTQARSSARAEESPGARWDDDGGFEPDVVDEAPTPGPGSAGLSLRGVLSSALPHELGTQEAPENYQVSAVFSRRVLPEERELIEGPDTAARLAESGYPGVGLAVADRRLEIGPTNLAMLAGGLASEIAQVLRDVEQQVVTARERREDDLRRWRETEAARAARVEAEADRVRFE